MRFSLRSNVAVWATTLYLCFLLRIVQHGSHMAWALEEDAGEQLPDISETHKVKDDRKLRGEKKTEKVQGGKNESQADKTGNNTLVESKTPPKDETLEYTAGWKKDFEDEEQYLYGKDALPVIDYHATQDMENPMRPDFLFSNNNPARIVEFYAVWCPHCRHFRSHYLQLAKQVTAIAEDNNMGEVKVYAVACNLYREICKQYDVEGFPQIRLFKANSTEVVDRVQYWEAHAFDMLLSLGLSRPAQDFGGKMDPIVFGEEFEADLNNPKTVSMIQKHHRTKSELYNDAYLSFDFSMRNGIFMTNGALDNRTAEVFYEWLELLKRSMPVAWKVSPVVTELLKEFETVKKGEHELVKVLDKFPRPESNKWSLACTHGEKGAGYTCGLWEFFHIMSIGVVEWNLMIYEGDHMILSTEEASRRLRNFIEKFFGCNECRLNFVNTYDQCGFDRCHRLKEPDDPTAENTQEEWMELPLWLFETHNAVNLRLMKERAEREGATWNHEDEVNSQWPSRKDCPRCWREDGAWDDLYVYKYLRAEYWPDDSITELYRTALNEPLPVFDDDEFSPSTSKMPSLFVQLLPISIVAGIGIWWFIRKEELRRSGLHKRIE